MAIDSVGGGSRDPNEALRSKRLQEERAATLKAAEERREQELERLVKSRTEDLVNIAENQTREIAAKQAESDNRVEIAKSVAENRARSFEAESQKMTDEAKKQFEAKARQLQNSTKELDTQRTQLLKSHEGAMERIRSSSAEGEARARQQGQRESALAHINAVRRIEELNERGEAEAAKLGDEIEETKRTIVNEGARKLATTKQNYDDFVNQVDKQIDLTKRSGEEQIQRSREQLNANEQRLSLDADARAERLNLDNQRMLARQHAEGQRKFMETQYESNRELSDVNKHNKDQIRGAQNKASFAMATIQTEAETQEAIARQSYAAQKKALTENRDKAIVDSSKANEALQKKLQSEYELKSKTFSQLRDQQIISQLAADESQIKYHRDEGKRQLNAQVADTAEKLASHGTKAADAFYHVHQMGARVEDNELETVIRVPVAEHEQDNLRISLQHNSITVSGTRRFQDKVKLEDGHQATSNQYQSYTESFPVKGKLDQANMTRGYADGVVTFRIPKG
ncbi:MAG: Hsp20 family protein [Deltaproteobacteria bacterium]|nr:Hsp20 family protein [Deltaproteobacteria bacterium]